MLTAIVLIFNTFIGFFVFYRIGKQSVINDLIKVYNGACRENEDNQIMIRCLKEQLKDKENKQ